MPFKKQLDDIGTLRRIIPICANCEQIRDDTGFWSQVEDYVQNHTEVMFSESLCPDCLKALDTELEETKIEPESAGKQS